MSFLEDIFARLDATGDIVLLELHDLAATNAATNKVSWGVTGQGLLLRIAQCRIFLAGRGLKKGDCCALLAQNSIEWVALDLAIMAEGLIVVPLYSRQAPAELVSMMKDCSPSLICCGDAALRDAMLQEWPELPVQVLFGEIFDRKDPQDTDEGQNTRAGAPAPH